jgi:predicted MPP superfamily phosphohydrolase
MRIVVTIISNIALLVLVASVLLGSHYLVYSSFIHFFHITNSTARYVLTVIVSTLSISFIVTSIVAHYYETIATRAAYFLSGLWLGLLVNLVLVFLFLWLVLVFGRFVGIATLSPLFVGVLLVAAVAVSGYGVWCALHPVVQSISVHLPQLPETWKDQTIVQLSDVHLGHVYQAGFLSGVVAQVNALHPKMVVITGDLFDGMDGHLDSLVQPFNDIEAPDGVYFIIGNHETYLGVETALQALQGTQVTVLKDEVRDIGGLRLIGLSFPKRGEEKDVVATLRSLRDQYVDRPNILLYHAPTRIAEIAESGVNLMLSGHTHQGQQFPFQLLTHWVHHGYDYGLYAIGNFRLYTSSGVGTWGPTMRIGTQSEIVAITLK